MDEYAIFLIIFIYFLLPLGTINFLLNRAIKRNPKLIEEDEPFRLEFTKQELSEIKKRGPQNIWELKSEYKKTIYNGVDSYDTLKKFLNHPEHLFVIRDELPKFIMEGYVIYIAVPAICHNDTVEMYEDAYEKNAKEGKAPASFYFKRLENCDDCYTGVVDNYEYALVKDIGTIRTFDKYDSKYQWLLVNDWLYEAIRIKKR